MSVRAYRINKIDFDKSETFNLWHDEKLVKFFDEEYGFFETMNEGTGTTELPVDALERAVKELDIDADVKESLKKDIDWAKAKKEDYIQYYCF